MQFKCFCKFEDLGSIKLDCAVCAVEALKLVRPFGLLQPKKR